MDGWRGPGPVATVRGGELGSKVLENKTCNIKKLGSLDTVMLVFQISSATTGHKSLFHQNYNFS